MDEIMIEDRTSAKDATGETPQTKSKYKIYFNICNSINPEVFKFLQD